MPIGGQAARARIYVRRGPPPTLRREMAGPRFQAAATAMRRARGLRWRGDRFRR